MATVHFISRDVGRVTGKYIDVIALHETDHRCRRHQFVTEQMHATTKYASIAHK